MVARMLTKLQCGPLDTRRYDHTVRFWEVQSGLCVRTLQFPDSVPSYPAFSSLHLDSARRVSRLLTATLRRQPRRSSHTTAFTTLHAHTF